MLTHPPHYIKHILTKDSLTQRIDFTEAGKELTEYWNACQKKIETKTKISVPNTEINQTYFDQKAVNFCGIIM
ncbi:MAG: hypothetical protein PV340_02615 [Wolbachia sp.]|nr:hypothetical protein [Wolbachia sp.]MDD9336789.1 hypothetical protein [Wolbachia sp.]